MPRAFNGREKEAIRLRLIEAGKRTLNRSGTRNLRIEEVTQEAGISKGSFYAFFPSKEDFILSVFESWESRYRAALLEKTLASPGDARSALEALFTEAFAILGKEPGLASLSFREVDLLMEKLPPERIAAHLANDEKVMRETYEAWRGADIIEDEDFPALMGIFNCVFIIAMHHEDFPKGSFEPTARFMAEAFAMRLAKGGKAEKA